MKKLFCLLLLVIELVSIIPVIAIAEPQGMFFAGVEIKPDLFYRASGTTLDTTTSNLAEIWFSDDTLYLKNFTIDLEDAKDGIEALDKDLIICIQGENKILNANNYGITANKLLCITGENKQHDTLKITSGGKSINGINLKMENISYVGINNYNSNICADDYSTITNCKIQIESNGTCISVNGNDMTINNSQIELTSNNEKCIFAYNSMYLNNCDVKARAKEECILVEKDDLVIGSSSLDLFSDTGSAILVRDGYIDNRALLHIKDNSTVLVKNTVEDRAIYCGGDMLVENSSLTVFSSCYGIYVENNIEFNNSKLNLYIEEMISNENEIYTYGIEVFKDMIINNSELIVETIKPENDLTKIGYMDSTPIYVFGKLTLNSGLIKVNHSIVPEFQNSESGILGRSGIYIPDNYVIVNAGAFYDYCDEFGRYHDSGASDQIYLREEFELGITDCIRALDEQWLIIADPKYLYPNQEETPVPVPDQILDKNGIPVVFVGEHNEIEIDLDSDKYFVNGVAIAAVSPAFIDNNRTYLGVRDISRALGIDSMAIKWNDKTKTALITKSGATIEITKGSDIIKMTYKGYIYEIKSDASALIRNNRIYLPFRVLFQIFGYEVNWNGNTRTIICK